MKVGADAMSYEGWNNIESILTSHLESFDTNMIEGSAGTTSTNPRIQTLLTGLEK
jgi:hypothetical protein